MVIFKSFEGLATQFNWDEGLKTCYLALLVKGDLQASYQNVNPLGTTPFPEHMGQTNAFHGFKFQDIHLLANENPLGLAGQVQNTLTQRLGRKTLPEVLEALALEQFISPLVTFCKDVYYNNLNPHFRWPFFPKFVPPEKGQKTKKV